MQLPRKGFLGKCVELWRFAAAQKVSIHASYACYFMVLAVFPLLVLLLSLLRYSGLSVESLLQVLEGVFPQALMGSVRKLILSTYYSTSGTVISLSAVAALWSASRGIYGLLSGLNYIYDAEEDRGWFFTRTVSVLYTFGFLVVLQLTLLLQVFGNSMLEFALGQDGFWLYLAQLIDLRFFLLFFLQTILFSAMFMVLPNRKNAFMDSLPGALLSSIGWLVFTDIYSVYVERFAAYTNVFGSVYAIALSMLWLYFCVSILFYGGVLNHYLMDKK